MCVSVCVFNNIYSTCSPTTHLIKSGLERIQVFYVMGDQLFSRFRWQNPLIQCRFISKLKSRAKSVGDFIITDTFRAIHLDQDQAIYIYIYVHKDIEIFIRDSQTLMCEKKIIKKMNIVFFLQIFRF